MTLGALLLLLVGVAATAWTLVRTRRLARRAADWGEGEALDVELPDDVRGLLAQGEDDLAARLLARRIGVPLADARAVIEALPPGDSERRGGAA